VGVELDVAGRRWHAPSTTEPGTCTRGSRPSDSANAKASAKSNEVDAGFVLTCQTFPVSDTVTVDFDA